MDIVSIHYKGVMRDNFNSENLPSYINNKKIYCLILENCSLFKLTEEGWIFELTDKIFNFLDIETNKIFEVNSDFRTIKKYNPKNKPSNIFQHNNINAHNNCNNPQCVCVNVLYSGLAINGCEDLNAVCADVEFVLLKKISSVLKKIGCTWIYVNTPEKFYFYDFYNKKLWKIFKCKYNKAKSIKCNKMFLIDINTDTTYNCINGKWMSKSCCNCGIMAT